MTKLNRKYHVTKKGVVKRNPGQKPERPRERKFYFAYKGAIVDYREAMTEQEARENFFSEFDEDVGAELYDEDMPGVYEVTYEGVDIDIVRAVDEDDAVNIVKSRSRWSVKYADDGSRPNPKRPVER